MRAFRCQRGLGAVFVCVVLSAAAQLCLKAGMNLFDVVTVAERVPAGLLHNPILIQSFLWIVIGLSLYVASLLLWIHLLGYVALNLAYSVLSLNYVLVYIVATQWTRIGEVASLERTTGIIIIILGVMVVMTDAETHTPENRQS